MQGDFGGLGILGLLESLGSLAALGSVGTHARTFVRTGRTWLLGSLETL